MNRAELNMSDPCRAITSLRHNWYPIDVEMQDARRKLIDSISTDVSDSRVLTAMRAVPRERFVPQSRRHAAYEDVALPTTAGQTISQPTIIGVMLQALELRRTDRVLEIGTGTGYQAALLAEIVRDVTTVERIPELVQQARIILEQLAYSNISVEFAMQTLGRTEDGPYDAIVVAAAAPRIPTILIGQLEVGGRMVVPIGGLEEQTLMKITKTADSLAMTSLGACRFVPLIGEGGWPEHEISEA